MYTFFAPNPHTQGTRPLGLLDFIIMGITFLNKCIVTTLAENAKLINSIEMTPVRSH